MYAASILKNHSNNGDENSNPKSEINYNFRNNNNNNTTGAGAAVATMSVPSLPLPTGQLIEQGSEIDVLSGEINFEKMYYKLLLDTYPSDKEIKQMDVSLQQQQQQHMDSSSSISSAERSVATDIGLVEFIASLKVSHNTIV